MRSQQLKKRSKIAGFTLNGKNKSFNNTKYSVLAQGSKFVVLSRRNCATHSRSSEHHDNGTSSSKRQRENRPLMCGAKIIFRTFWCCAYSRATFIRENTVKQLHLQAQLQFCVTACERCVWTICANTHSTILKV